MFLGFLKVPVGPTLVVTNPTVSCQVQVMGDNTANTVVPTIVYKPYQAVVQFRSVITPIREAESVIGLLRNAIDMCGKRS